MERRTKVIIAAVVIVCGVPPFLCGSCCVFTGAFGSHLEEQERAALATARAACTPPMTFRVRADARASRAADYECLSPQMIAAEAAKRAEDAARAAAAQQEQARALAAQGQAARVAAEAQAERARVAAEAQAERARVAAEAQATASMEQVLADASSVVRESPGDDVIAYDGRLQALAQTLSAAPAAARERFGRDIDRRAAAIDRRRSSIRRQVERAERERAELALYRTLCGTEAPTLSAWDGELVGAERAMAESAHDPDSIDVENCSRPVLMRENCWSTTCRVRGANMFGALVLSRVRFNVAAHNRILGYRSL